MHGGKRRGAGGQKLYDYDPASILNLRKQGWTYKEIAKIMHLDSWRVVQNVCVKSNVRVRQCKIVIP